MLPLVLLSSRPGWRRRPPPRPGSPLVALALFCTSLAYILYFQLLASAGATNSLLVTFLIPITAILLGALILGERLEPRHFVGMALIGAGLAAIDGRLLSRSRRLGLEPAAAARVASQSAMPVIRHTSMPCAS